MAMIVAVGCAIYGFLEFEEKNHMRRILTPIKWEEYRGHCGYQAFTKNPRDAFRAFEMKYFGKAITWDGYVIRVNLNDDDPMSMAYHSVNILLKM